jgi:hypothetical protein
MTREKFYDLYNLAVHLLRAIEHLDPEYRFGKMEYHSPSGVAPSPNYLPLASQRGRIGSPIITQHQQHQQHQGQQQQQQQQQTPPPSHMHPIHSHGGSIGSPSPHTHASVYGRPPSPASASPHPQHSGHPSMTGHMIGQGQVPPSSSSSASSAGHYGTGTPVHQMVHTPPHSSMPPGRAVGVHPSMYGEMPLGNGYGRCVLTFWLFICLFVRWLGMSVFVPRVYECAGYFVLQVIHHQ